MIAVGTSLAQPGGRDRDDAAVIAIWSLSLALSLLQRLCGLRAGEVTAAAGRRIDSTPAASFCEKQQKPDGNWTEYDGEPRRADGSLHAGPAQQRHDRRTIRSWPRRSTYLERKSRPEPDLLGLADDHGLRPGRSERATRSQITRAGDLARSASDPRATTPKGVGRIRRARRPGRQFSNTQFAMLGPARGRAGRRQGQRSDLAARAQLLDAARHAESDGGFGYRAWATPRPAA